jgi:shikimate dehydrogenase
LTESPDDAAPFVSERPGRLVLLGKPVGHSLSPTFQNAALRAAKIPLVYEAIEVDERDLSAMLRELGQVSAIGNVTIPHKRAVHDHCDELTELARRVGAVNTFRFESGRLHGDNTDVGGFDAAARALLGGEPREARVVVMGAGGAAAAVLAAIERWKSASASIVARNGAMAEALVERFPDVARVETKVDRALAKATLIVNATPIGQQDDEQPLDVSMIPRSTAVLDLVYRKGGTPWVRAARARGNRAADGLTMLLEQGALSFQRWFGYEPDREAMRRSVI